jgi:hypothetical protein
MRNHECAKAFLYFCINSSFLCYQAPRRANSFEYCNHIAIAISSLNFSMAFAPSSTTVVGGSEVPAFSSLFSFVPLAHSARLSSNSNISSSNMVVKCSTSKDNVFLLAEVVGK